MKSHWIEHKGKSAFFADYSGFGSDFNALRQEVEEAVDVYYTRTKGIGAGPD
jgi:hypothetical protein